MLLFIYALLSMHENFILFYFACGCTVVSKYGFMALFKSFVSVTYLSSSSVFLGVGFVFWWGFFFVRVFMSNGTF